MKKLFLFFAFVALFTQFSFAVDNQELKDLLADGVKNSNFKPYIEESSDKLVRLLIFNPSSANSATEIDLIKKAIFYASEAAAPYSTNLLDLRKNSYSNVKDFVVYVLRKSQTEPAVLNMIGANSGEVRAIASFPDSADTFRVFVFIDDSPYNPASFNNISQNEFLLETIINFIHEVYGHAFEVIKSPSLARQSNADQEIRAYTVQLEGLKKLKQNRAGLFDAKTKKLLDIYIEDTKAKIEYFKANNY